MQAIAAKSTELHQSQKGSFVLFSCLCMKNFRKRRNSGENMDSRESRLDHHPIVYVILAGIYLTHQEARNMLKSLEMSQ